MEMKGGTKDKDPCPHTYSSSSWLNPNLGLSYESAGDRPLYTEELLGKASGIP